MGERKEGGFRGNGEGGVASVFFWKEGEMGRGGRDRRVGAWAGGRGGKRTAGRGGKTEGGEDGEMRNAAIGRGVLGRADGIFGTKSYK